MKLLITYSICFLIIHSSFQISAISNTNNKTYTDITIQKQIDVSNYVYKHMINGSLYKSNQNVMSIPIVKETIILPFYAQNISVSYTINNTNFSVIKREMIANNTPILFPLNKQLIDLSSYSTNVLQNRYHNITPKITDTFSYSIGCGLSNNNQVLYLTLQFYPMVYHSLDNSYNLPSSLEYKITYEIPNKPNNKKSSVDMVIICPEVFEESIERLVEHKNQIGTTTIIKTTNEIYNQYSGRDNPEKIKYFIYDAVNQWNISYVLLFGGHIGQTEEWYIPVRYSNLHDRSFWNDSYVTDLYYADIYRYNNSLNTVEFEDWDSNKNNIFGEWTWIYDPVRGWWYELDKKDNLDLYPDVSIGRLACRNRREVESVIDKIIWYETDASIQNWFKSIVLCGGDTFPFADGCEGEIENNKAFEYLEPLGFEPKKLWVTYGSLKGPLSVIREINKGAGFLYLSGHGTPREWCTHPELNDYKWIDLYSFEMNLMNNKHKYPICIVGGCHNSQFDVSLSQIKIGIQQYGFSYFLWNYGIDNFFKWMWVPSCWSWNLVSLENKGCIAVIGNTGLGYGVGGQSCTEYSEGYLTTRFFKNYAILSQQDIHSLGVIHTETLNEYISHFSANQNLIDRKTVEQWVLLGDPSLRIGGFE